MSRPSLPPAVAARWEATSLRERRMLALMTLALGAFVYWFALLAPLSTWAGEARERHALAKADAAALAPVLEALDALPRVGPPATPAGARAGAEALDLPVRQPGPNTLEIGPASPERVFAWLERQRQAGQLPPRMRLQPAGEQAVIRVEFAATR